MTQNLDAARAVFDQGRLATQLAAAQAAFDQTRLARQLAAIEKALDHGPLARQLAAIEKALDHGPLARQLAAIEKALDHGPLARQLAAIEKALDHSPLAKNYGRDRTLTEVARTAAANLDFEGSPASPDIAAHGGDGSEHEEPEFVGGPRVGRPHAEENKSSASSYSQIVRQLPQVFWRVDLVLLGTLTTGLREAIGEVISSVAEYVVLSLWLSAAIQAPSPPPSPTLPRPDTLQPPSDIVEEFSLDRRVPHEPSVESIEPSR